MLGAPLETLGFRRGRSFRFRPVADVAIGLRCGPSQLVGTAVEALLSQIVRAVPATSASTSECFKGIARHVGIARNRPADGGFGVRA